MKTISRIFVGGTWAALASLTPVAAGAAIGERADGPDLAAPIDLVGTGRLAPVAMSDDELDTVRGGALIEVFTLGAFNLAIVPQFNICIFCNGVDQSNFAFVFGLNDLP